MEIISLGNRKFRVIETSTFGHRMDMEQLMLESGVTRILQTIPTFEGLDPAARALAAGKYATEVYEAIARAGKVFAVLGGLLIPEEIADTDWTQEVARDTGAFLRKISSPEEMAALRFRLLEMVMGFFVGALASSEPSGIVSRQDVTRALTADPS